MKTLVCLILITAAVAARGQSSGIRFDGIAKFEDHCSASLIRFHQSIKSDKALLLTNAHCIRFLEDTVKPELLDETHGVDEGRIGFYVKDHEIAPAWVYPVELINYKTNQRYTVKAKNVLYATRSLTDIALVQLDETYEFLSHKGISPLTLSETPANAGDSISIVTGLFDREFDCRVDKVIPILLADVTYFRNALRYSKECEVYKGTSGSPVISDKTGEIVGINSLKNDPNVRDCEKANLCEYQRGGKIEFNPYRSGYATDTHLIYTCLNKKRQIDLTLPHCQLFGSANQPN